MIDATTALLLELVLREWGPGGLLCYDARGPVLWVSEDFGPLLGLSEPLAPGAPIAGLWDYLRHGRERAPLDPTRALERRGHLDLSLAADGPGGARRVRLSRHALGGPDAPRLVLARDLTERPSAAPAPRPSPGVEGELECYRDMVATSSDALVYVDRELNYRVVNAAYLKLWRRREEDVIGRSVPEVLGRALFDTRIAERFRRCFEGGCEVLSCIDEFPDSPVAGKHLETTYRPHAGPRGETIGVLVTIRDVTERVLAERAVRDSEQGLASLFRAAPIGIAILKDGVLRQVNPRLCDLLGYRPGELIGRTISGFYLTDAEYERVARETDAALRDAGVGEVETIFRSADDTPLAVWLKSAWLDPRCEEAGVTLTVLDISELKAQERSLRENEQRARALLEAMPDLMFRLDHAGVVLDYKARREDLVEQEADLIGRRLRDISPAAFADLIEGNIAATLVSGKLEEFEFNLEIPGSGRRDWEARMVRSGAGEVIATVRDISERKAAAARLHTLSAVVEQSREALLLTDVHFRVTYLNPAFERLFGWSLDDLRGQTPDLLNAEPEPVASQNEIYRRLLNGGEVFQEALNRRRDGSLFYCQFRVSPLLDAAGECVGYMGTQRDVSEPRRLRQALVMAQKMEAIGRLTGGIAHDFNNILGSVLGFAELARLRHGGADPILDGYLEQIDIAGMRARDLVRQLLVFARGDRIEGARLIPLAPRIRDLMRMLKPLLPPDLEIRLELEDESLLVRIDLAHLHQILMNLALNAKDAMPDGGRLGVGLRASHLEAGECRICAESVQGDWTELIVSDTGGGIPEEHLDLMFQPFFSTKPIGEGSGMGLAVVAGLARTYGGHVLVDSRLGEGSVFHVLLPCEGRCQGTAERQSKDGAT